MTNRSKKIELGVYLSVSALAFLAATLVTDVIARISFSAVSLPYAIGDHFKYANLFHSILMLTPFAIISLICARLEIIVKTRSSLSIFLISTGALTYFYANGFWSAQSSLHQQRWTTSSLSVGLLPFIGFGIVFVTIFFAALATQLDRRDHDG
ncbi:MAG: hypothetical protein R3E02_04220 [Blastomonas sp.]